MNNIFNIFGRPYPYSDRQHNIVLTSIGTGLFIAFFLLVFQPFGTAEATFKYKVLKIGGFGVVTTVVMSVYFSLLSRLLSHRNLDKHWTVGKEILIYAGLLIGIGLGNSCYSIAIGINAPTLASFLGMFYSTFLVGIFPVTFFIILDYVYLLKKNIAEAEALQVNKTKKHAAINKEYATPLNEPNIHFLAENNKDDIHVAAKDLLYLESSSNYVTVVYKKQDVIQKTLLRSSLTRLEKQIENEHILRCHRSFIVNLQQVEHISGNAQGYKLQLKQTTDIVPVARKYAKIVSDYFQTA